MSSPMVARDQTFTALVLAGQRGPEDPVARATGQRWKAMAPTAGVPMVQRVLQALLESRSVGSIAVAAPVPDLLQGLDVLQRPLNEGRIRLLPTAEGPASSTATVWSQLGRPCPTLVTTADHALLTPALVDVFCEKALTKGGDLVAALVPEAAIRAAFPDSRRTYLRFRGGAYSGANLFALLTPDALQAVEFWCRVEQDRKRPWRIARKVGFASLLAYLLHQLSLEEALQRLSAVAGADARAALLEEAWAAVDVDKPEDLQLAERILVERAGTAADGDGGPLSQALEG